MGELLLVGLSEEAQKTDQMGVEILSDTSSYMYGMRGAHHGQAGYTTLGEPESGLESLIEMVDAMDSSAAEEMAPVAQHAIGRCTSSRQPTACTMTTARSAIRKGGLGPPRSMLATHILQGPRWTQRRWEVARLRHQRHG